MATLTNTKIKDTYVGLLKTTDNEAIDAAGVTLLEDGAGNASALSVGRASNGVTITGTATATAFAGPLTGNVIGNVTGNLTGSVLTAAQTNITSVGTLSSLAVSGNLTVDTNTLFVDAANNRVGIGTSSPDTIVDIVGDKPILTIRDTDSSTSTATSTLRLAESDAGDTLGKYWDIELVPINAFTVSNDGSERMRIDSSGRVGIGTSSPSVKLQVIENVSGWTTWIENQGTGAGNSGLIVTAGEDNGDNTFLLRKQNGTETFAVKGDGNVGIGTSSPAVKLDVVGQVRASTGILFGSDTAAANALDDYEEGTWSPVYVPTTGSFATMTMDAATAKYTKIGNMVTVFAFIRTDDVDITGGSGQVVLNGLPFAAGSGFGGGIAVGQSALFSTPPIAASFEQNNTFLRLRTSLVTAMTPSDLLDGTNANSNTLMFTGTYMTS